MNDSVTIELTKDQRDVLLRGLRFVRSSIKLEIREPDNEDEIRRSNELQEIASLADRLNGALPTNATAKV